MRNFRNRPAILLAAVSVGLAGAVAVHSATSAHAGTQRSAASGRGESSMDDPLMIAARAELGASNGHDLLGFLQAFAQNPVILVDAPSYSYHGRAGLAEFFRQNSLGSRVQYSIKPGAPQTEDRAGDHAYLEMVVNVGATNPKGDSFNDPIHWIAALERQDGVWKIDVLTLTAAGM